MAARTYRPLQMHRIKFTDLTESQVAQALAGKRLKVVTPMARLQGQTGSRHWESGRLEGRYVKAQGQWKIASLNYVTA